MGVIITLKSKEKIMLDKHISKYGKLTTKFKNNRNFECKLRNCRKFFKIKLGFSTKFKTKFIPNVLNNST